MVVLGVSCYYHDACAALIRDGEVIAAAQEERFDRNKYSPVFPLQAVNWCLQEAGITIYDVDEVAFYEKMYLKFERTILSHLSGWPFTLRSFVDTMPIWLKDRLAVAFTIEDELRFKKPVYHVKHHLSHAASSFLVSPFESAAILTVDGVGEYASASWGRGSGTSITMAKEIHYPHSLGLLYSIVTAFLGFQVFTGEGKVMALAEFGEPDFMDHFSKVMNIYEDGSFHLNTEFFQFNRGDRMHGPKFLELFGPAREKDSELTDRHKAIACSLQRTTEKVLLKMARHVHKETGERYVCLAGGCFLNVTANSVIRDEGPFDDLFIQPAVGDAGAALGAAAYVYHTVLGNPRKWVMNHAALGCGYSEYQMETMLRNRRAEYRKLEPDELIEETSRRLAEGQIVGWFQGRMEFGPRALGNRSILANPGQPGIKERLNQVIKHREEFRPFGASVLADHVGEYFEIDKPSPFMLMVYRIRDEKADEIKAVAHINQTCRIQTVTAEDNGLYHTLIEAFRERTGIPMVLNTSFNDSEPIVCKPEEAWACYDRTQMDACVIGPFVISRTN
jgi:carbamoyltransferase